MTAFTPEQEAHIAEIVRDVVQEETQRVLDQLAAATRLSGLERLMFGLSNLGEDYRLATLIQRHHRKAG